MYTRSSMLFEYEDPEDGCKGFLAYSGTLRPLAAGGFRVQPGLTAARVWDLAQAMRLKENALSLNVDGAKCGIDFDPRAPGKQEAMRRFLRWLEPHLRDRLSLGPDMGTSFSEIESLARANGVSSVKAAIARAQGLPERQVLQRLLTLQTIVGPLAVGERRAGHALAHAALAAARGVGLAQEERSLTCALQGFGTLGRGAAVTLSEAGAVFTAIADEYGCMRNPQGLGLGRMLAKPLRAPVPADAGPGDVMSPREQLLCEPVDVLVLAACEDAVTLTAAEQVCARVVVVGANNGLSAAVEQRLHERGVLVVPDFIGGAGGSAAMDALFAPPLCPDPASVLARVALLARTLVERMLSLVAERLLTPREAALTLAHDGACTGDQRPYGLRLLQGLERAPADCGYVYAQR
jgi:glutamate dehydrogenase/leucine dehydrogenase